MLIARRRFLIGSAVLICAPAIVQASSLMPVRAIDDWGWTVEFYDAEGRMWEYRYQTSDPARRGEVIKLTVNTQRYSSEPTAT